jgi:protein tyrosine phosphatase
MIIQHYQLTDWLDGDVPNKKSKKWMDYLINEFLDTIKNNSIPVVHCSAGVGRTGTFILMALIRLIISTNSNISIFNEVRKVR